MSAIHRGSFLWQAEVFAIYGASRARGTIKFLEGSNILLAIFGPLLDLMLLCRLLRSYSFIYSQ